MTRRSWHVMVHILVFHYGIYDWTTAVTKVDTEDKVPWVHGHVTRRLFQDDNICTHVKYMSMKYLNVLRQETLTPLEENEILLDVQEKLSNEKPL